MDYTWANEDKHSPWSQSENRKRPLRHETMPGAALMVAWHYQH